MTVGIAPEQRAPRAVRVRLVCTACGVAPVIARLRPRGGLTWSARGAPARRRHVVCATSRSTGDRAARAARRRHPGGAGAPPVHVLAVADLSGPYAERCRAHVIGLELALARMNADGGLDGGRKVAPLVLDSGGTAAGAARAARRGLAAGPVAVGRQCGTGGVAAVEAASRGGRPERRRRPGGRPDGGRRRLPARGRPVRTGRRVRPARAQPDPGGGRAWRAHGARGRRRRPAVTAAAGGPARSGCARPRRRRARRRRPDPSRAWSSSRPARWRSSRSTRSNACSTAAGRPRSSSTRPRAAVPTHARSRGSASIAAPAWRPRRCCSPSACCRRPTSAARPRSGRIGAIQGVSEVATNTADAELYKTAVPLLFRGDIASVDGLRGYVDRPGAARRAALGHRPRRDRRAPARAARVHERAARAVGHAPAGRRLAVRRRAAAAVPLPDARADLVRRRGEGHRVLPAGQLDGHVRRSPGLTQGLRAPPVG